VPADPSIREVLRSTDTVEVLKNNARAEVMRRRIKLALVSDGRESAQR
jgi:hypothetical protein